MRNPLANDDVKLLRYGIREIVDVAQRLRELDEAFELIPENIGDPIKKGWPVPPFLKVLITEEVAREKDLVFGYAHSRGLPSARQWVVEHAARHAPSATLDPEYVLFVSGLGAGISSLYHMLPKGLRVIQPTPSYPTHASMESFAAVAESISYRLDPDNAWQPDLAELESKIISHPEVTGILIINPNNPTGAVYDRETLEGMVSLAEKYNLMLVSDEVYFRMVYNGHEYVQITEIAQGRVPLVVLRGMSKDVPWPGGRCGWLEFHNVDLDADYRAYADAVKKRVMMEVCSVSLPQFILSRVYDHPDFEAWLASYNQNLEANGNYIAEVLGAVEGVQANRTNGAFYQMPLFEPGVLREGQHLNISNDAARAYIEGQVGEPGFPLDKRFAYYLLATTGVCVTPASDFFSPHLGFRVTTLERDPQRRKEIYGRVAQALDDYLRSA